MYFYTMQFAYATENWSRAVKQNLTKRILLSKSSPRSFARCGHE